MDAVTVWQIFWQNYWVLNLVLPLAVFLLIFAVSMPIVNVLFRILKKAAERTGSDWGKKLEYGFHKPLHLLVIAVGLYVAFNICPAVWNSIFLQSLVIRCFRSFLILALAWGLYRMADSVELNDTIFARKFDLQVDTALLPVLSGVIRFVIAALAILIVAQEWNFSISGLLAGLGLGGLAFALAAKDMLANLFGGLVILLDRPFSIGDWIRTGDVEGTVEEVNFRSVKVRTFSQAVVTVPNSKVADSPVTNFSRMGKRKVDFSLSLKYENPAERIKECTEKIRELLAENEEIENDTFTAALDSLGESGLKLMVSYYTKSADFKDYVRIREEIYYSVLEILEHEKVEMAYPTSTVVMNQSEK